MAFKRSSTIPVVLIIATVFIFASGLTLMQCGQKEEVTKKPETEIVKLDPVPTLADKLLATVEASSANTPPEIIAVGKAQRDFLRETGILEAALNVGDTAPSFELSNAVGEVVSLTKLLADGPIVLVFYRGGW